MKVGKENVKEKKMLCFFLSKSLKQHSGIHLRHCLRRHQMSLLSACIVYRVSSTSELRM